MADQIDPSALPASTDATGMDTGVEPYVVQIADPDEDTRKVELAVKAVFKQFKRERNFDKNIRLQIAKDRQYASGQAQAAWAVSTNLVGSMIDILVAVLYARDPDLSARKSPLVDDSPDPATGLPQGQTQSSRDKELLARTVELVVSRLWKQAGMKKRMKRIVRAVLSTGQGWLKIVPMGEMKPDPLVQTQVSTLKDNLASVERLQAAIAAGETVEGGTASADDLDVQKQQLDTTLASLMTAIEKMVYECIIIDVVKPENLQVGIDVELLDEYLDSESITEVMYFPKESALTRFPELKSEDIKSAETFYRRAPVNANKGQGADPAGSMLNAMYPTLNEEGEEYGTTDTGEDSTPFIRVLEKWNRKDNHVYTAISGVKVWARAPYQPAWASNRFYPYFYFSIYEVDGSRAPQSLSDRLAKLQDEYSSTRSNFRVSRERSIPGGYFNAGTMADEEATKLKNGLREELSAIKFTDPNQDLGKVFAEKPVSKLDPRLYDTTPIIQDMERMSGVQEAQQATSSVEKTATQTEIEQAGFSTRTGAARDQIESTLTEVAQYCAEIALQCIKPETVTKMVGPAAFWPYGLAVDDVLSLVEVEITAGTTGKPRNRGDREAWATVMPLIKDMQVQIASLQASPATLPLAQAMKELLKETLVRMGDDSDVERFLPQPPMLPPVPTDPGAPPVDPVSGAPTDPTAPASPLPAGPAGAPVPPDSPPVSPPSIPGV